MVRLAANGMEILYTADSVGRPMKPRQKFGGDEVAGRAVIAKVAAGEVSLELTAVGTVKVAGDEAAVNVWLPLLKANRRDIRAALISERVHQMREVLPPPSGPLH